MQTYQDGLDLPRPISEHPQVAQLEKKLTEARREAQEARRELEHLRATRREKGSTTLAQDLYRAVKLMKSADPRAAIEEMERMLDELQPGEAGWRTWI
jgi:thioesterase domain-containing protein